MELEPRKNWKEENAEIESKQDVLNGVAYEEVSDVQQMLYHVLKRVEALQARVAALEQK